MLAMPYLPTKTLDAIRKLDRKVRDVRIINGAAHTVIMENGKIIKDLGPVKKQQTGSQSTNVQKKDDNKIDNDQTFIYKNGKIMPLSTGDQRLETKSVKEIGQGHPIIHQGSVKKETSATFKNEIIDVPVHTPVVDKIIDEQTAIPIVEKGEVKTNDKPLTWICEFCDDGTAFSSEQGLAYHIYTGHKDMITKKELKELKEDINMVKETEPKELKIEVDKSDEIAQLRKELDDLKNKLQDDENTRAEKERIRKEIEDAKGKIDDGTIDDGTKAGQVIVQQHVRNTPKKQKRTTGSSIVDKMWGLDKEEE